jgi:sulfite oxidase
MRTELKEVDGIDWFDGAVMNCKWTGPRVKDILERAETSLTLEEQKKAHVAFACYAKPCQDDTWYGASIPLARAMDPDAEVILALKMNDQPLTVGHGYPVRVITPGIAGARAVKWLDRISIQTAESSNVYMQRDYKVLPEEATNAEEAEKFFPTLPPVQEMPVNSAVASPKSGTTVQREVDGTVIVQGYALPSGDGGPVTRVEVSGDDGRQWMQAEIIDHEGASKWSWVLWKAKLKIEPGSKRPIFSNAVDAAGNSQPRHSQWNLRGVCYNGFGEASDLTIK